MSYQLGLLAALGTGAAWFDARERRIPNWLTVSAFLLGFWLLGWQAAAAGAGLALAIHLPLWLLRATGGGDVKLMAAFGACLGLDDWLRFFLLNAILGGVAALIVVFRNRSAGQTFRRMGAILGSLSRAQAPFSADPTLAIDSAKARTLPRGVVAALALIPWFLLRGRW